jgi:ribose transport system permease protein
MIVPALLICVGLGTVVGLGNGLVITRMGVAPFVVTFAAFYILRGSAYALSTTPVGSAAPALDVVYNASVLGSPAVLLLWAFVWVVAWFALHFTAFGRHIYAIGGQQTVARLAGIKVDRIKIAVYVLCSVLAALGGLYELARITIGDPQVGEGLELDSITAVAIGGTSLFGGRGYLVGTFGGVLLLGVINNMFNLLQVNSFYQDLVKGIMILMAVAVYREKR